LSKETKRKSLDCPDLSRSSSGKPRSYIPSVHSIITPASLNNSKFNSPVFHPHKILTPDSKSGPLASPTPEYLQTRPQRRESNRVPDPIQSALHSLHQSHLGSKKGGHWALSFASVAIHQRTSPPPEASGSRTRFFLRR
jgi:hypothetical protein